MTQSKSIISLVPFLINANFLFFYSVIAYRKGNRIGFYLQCSPEKDLKPGEEVWLTFQYKHEHYGNTAIVALLKGEKQQSEPEPDWLKQTVFVNIGKISDI